jgi:hypothetical protein
MGVYSGAMMFNFDTTYSRLPVAMFSWVRPVGVRAPGVVILNEGLAGGSESIAQAYEGHQFGHFAMLGDGRYLFGVEVSGIVSSMISNPSESVTHVTPSQTQALVRY